MQRPPLEPPPQTPEAEDLRIRRTWWFYAGSLALACLVMGLRLATGDAGPLEWLLTALLVVAGAAAVVHRRAVIALELRRRIEAESTTRLLRGLSRSVSPDAIVGAIAGELASGVAADHVVVVRRRADPSRLEATLVSTRPGIPSSVTALPLSDLTDPVDGSSRRRRRAAAAIHVAPAARASAPSAGLRMATPLPAMAVGASAGAHGSRTAAGVVETGGPDGRAAAAAPVDAAAPWQGGAPSSAAASLPVVDPVVHPSSASGRPTGGRTASATLVAERIAERVADVYGLRNTLSAPLVAEGAVVGALVLSRRTTAAWPASIQRVLDEAASEASVALARATSYRAAEARASTDALTGLPNRRYFDEFCGLLARRRRAGDAVGVLMVDIDHFKRLNDRHGHAVGDEVLRAVAGAIGHAVREDDVPARYGGEEFAVLLRNPSRSIAVEIGERLRVAVGALDLRPFGVPAVSVSVGVAVQEAPDQPIADIIEEADRALYRAKRAGRDRVVAA